LTALPSPAAGRLEGERWKGAAHALLEARREVYIRRGRRALLSQLLRAGTATIDDVRDAVPLSADIGPKLLAGFDEEHNPLAEAGSIEAGDYVRSRRPEAHARPGTRWLLTDRTAALGWLAHNPNLPDADAEPTLSPDP
jgi:hypothetical protein